MADYFSAPRTKSKTMPGNRKGIKAPESKDLVAGPQTPPRPGKLNAAGVAKYKSRLAKFKSGGK